MAENSSSEIVGAFLVGGLIGAALGIMFAPAKGKDTREKLVDWMDETKEKAKEKLMLPEGTVRGAMGLENTSADLSSGSARDHLLMALNITDLSDLKVGGREIIVGSLQEKAHYQ